MKKNIQIILISISLMAMLSSTITHAAIGDWVARKKSQTKQYLVNKLRGVEQKTQELLTALRANSKCLVRGDCSSEKRKKLRVLAAAITTAITAIVAATVLARSRSDDVDAVPEIRAADSKKTRTAAIQEFLPGFVPDDSEPGMFMKAIQNGLLDKVKTYADLVAEHVLDAGVQFALRLQDVYPSQKNYQEIPTYLNTVKGSFSPALQRANTYLLSAVRAENEELVKSSYCANPTPSRNAITVGIEILINRSRRYAKEVYDTKIVPIINFLQKPLCER